VARVKLLLLALLIADARAQKPLTNEAVMKMVKSVLAEDVIVSMVRTQPAKYWLETDQLIAFGGGRSRRRPRFRFRCESKPIAA